MALRQTIAHQEFEAARQWVDARGWQAGVAPGGGVDLSGLLVRSALGHGRAAKRCTAALFSDLKAALNSAPVEAAVGPVLAPADWHAVLDGIGIPAGDRCWLPTTPSSYKAASRSLGFGSRGCGIPATTSS